MGYVKAKVHKQLETDFEGLRGATHSQLQYPISYYDAGENLQEREGK